MFKKGMTPWNKGKPMSKEAKKKIGNANRGRKHTEESKKKMSEKIKNHFKEHPESIERLSEHWKNEKNPNWKGDKAGYVALHDWVKSKLGKPEFCEFCMTTKKRKYHWANISGEYNRDLCDWLRLCVPCHSKFDISKK